MANSLADLSTCRRCPRLAAWHNTVARTYPDYHAAPVGAWGDARGRMLIVGLAPGLHGASRTGKAFVGDASGDFLFAGLNRLGFATHSEPAHAKLRGARITNAVKCLPPNNAPNSHEINNCIGYLRQELALFCPPGVRKVRVVLTLGGVAHGAVCKALELRRTPFGHGLEYKICDNLILLSSFHPSRLNVNTGRITQHMLDAVLGRALSILA